MNAIRSDRRAVVTGDGVRKAIPTEQLPPRSVHAVRLHVGKALAAQHRATEGIDEGQRRAVDAIAGPKRAFEVDGPDLVGRRRLQGGGPRVLPVRARATAADAPVSRQDVENGARRAPRHPMPENAPATCRLCCD